MLCDQYYCNFPAVQNGPLLFGKNGTDKEAKANELEFSFKKLLGYEPRIHVRKNYAQPRNASGLPDFEL